MAHVEIHMACVIWPVSTCAMWFSMVANEPKTTQPMWKSYSTCAMWELKNEDSAIQTEHGQFITAFTVRMGGCPYAH